MSSAILTKAQQRALDLLELNVLHRTRDLWSTPDGDLVSLPTVYQLRRLGLAVRSKDHRTCRLSKRGKDLLQLRSAGLGAPEGAAAAQAPQLHARSIDSGPESVANYSEAGQSSPQLPMALSSKTVE